MKAGESTEGGGDSGRAEAPSDAEDNGGGQKIAYCKCCADVVESLIGAMFIDAATVTSGSTQAAQSSRLLQEPSCRDKALEMISDPVMQIMVPVAHISAAVDSILQQQGKAARDIVDGQD